MVTRARNRGLILLIVLGMLSLFSLLAVTYVAFAGAARTSSLQMARRDHRGTSPDRLFDQAIKQVIRGTRDPDSALWRQSLLDDLYGALEEPIVTKARVGNGGNYPSGYTQPPLPIPFGAAHGPQLYNETFLKIPLEWDSAAPLPEHHDALTGRVLTFTSGPLANQSFRIMRYVGAIDTADLPTYDSIRYSVLIDLSSVQERNTSVVHTFNGTSTETKSVWQWIGSDSTGSVLAYADKDTSVNPPPPTLINPFEIVINAGAQNAPGIGITNDNTATPPINVATTASYAPTIGKPLAAPFSAIQDNLLPNHSHTNLVNRTGGSYSATGDTDEPYDAADFNNFFLALRRTAATTSDDVIPSFHRPEVINYLASLDTSYLSLASMTIDQFFSFLEVLQRATARPLSYSITGLPGTVQNNSHFTGGSAIELSNGARNPQLSFDWNNRAAAQGEFDAWLRWHLRGSWDVDNDGDGVKDSIWVDLNFPLSTSPDGKLLKVLAAFYIEDMDGKLDINAAGSQIQAVDGTYPLSLSGDRYAYLPAVSNWPQGLGFGPADIYMRHLFNDQQHHADVMKLRYNGKPGVDNLDDPVSQLIAHLSEKPVTNQPSRGMRPSRHAYNRFPGMPVSTHGRMGIALDLLGNPILMDNVTSVLEEEEDDPYESRVLSPGHSDPHISVADYERIVRFNDLDRSSLPANLEKKAAASWSYKSGSTLNTEYLNRLRSISPRNVMLNLPRFTRTYTHGSLQPRVASFIEFVEEYAQRRFGQSYPAIKNNQLAQLFPVEFNQNRPLDLNRPLGNGYDDDNNGMVDEPAELASITQKELYNGSSTINGNYTRGAREFDPGFDPQSTKTSVLTAAQFAPYSGNRSRQLLARHLYCLAQLILPVDSSGNNTYIFPNQTSTTASLDNAARARLLAQWAVNIVDFRDADVAMTRFPYDPDPFKDSAGVYAPGWEPDADHVVFGFEQPELLITESLAMHDTRVKKKAAPAQGYDQMRLPEGSLFLEFFCPRSTATNQAIDDLLPGLPRSLYNQANTTSPFALDLSRFVTDANGNVFPIWRVVLTKPNSTGSAAPEPDSFTRVFDGDDVEPAGPGGKSDSGLSSFNYSYQIGNTDAGLKWRTSKAANDAESTPNTPIAPPTIDRVLWFANIKPVVNTAATPPKDNTGLPGVTDAAAKIYYYREGVNQVQGGQYLVVGPRPMTYFGSKVQSLPRNHTPNNHRISLRYEVPSTNPVQYKYDWVQLWDKENLPGFWISNTPAPYLPTPAPALASFAGMVRPCVTMIAGADMPIAWPADPKITQTHIGLNISEPTPDAYYIQPTQVINSNDTTGDTTNGAPGYKTMSMDGYMDMSGPSASGSQTVFDSGASATTKYFLENHGWPVDSNGYHPKPMTQKNWSAAVLQRLADPDRAWHATLNPYITVDWQSIDLTVFSGEDVPAEEDAYYLATRARSGRHTKVANTSGGGFERTLGEAGQTFFSYESSFPTAPSTDPPAGGSPTDVYFKKEVLSEFYANQTTGITGQTRGNTGTFASLGYLNRSYTIRGTSGEYYFAYYQGVPSRTPDAPFFPNRNFVSALELANVPLSAPGTFHQEFYFEGPSPGSPVPPRHRHTFDFESMLSPATAKSAAELLDVVSVGSPWPDSWSVADPAKVAPVAGDLPRSALMAHYEAPFNFIPTYLEPGRVNLNTLTEPTVMRGLMGNIMPNTDRTAANPTVPYQTTFNSTVFATGTNNSVFQIRSPGSGNPNLNSTLPTIVQSPFTSTSANYMFPLTTLQRPQPVDTTLLRRTPTTPDQRLFHAGAIAAFTPGGATPINNSYIHNYPAARLANMTTDRSNVFAVRMTLGYFEYDPATGLGIEYGSEQGKSRRNRAFYMIDRSIPVGFRTGNDMNTNETILARRIIE